MLAIAIGLAVHVAALVLSGGEARWAIAGGAIAIGGGLVLLLRSIETRRFVAGFAYVFLMLPVLFGVTVNVVDHVLDSQNVYRRPPDVIEAYLRSETPLGSSEATVLAWLKTKGIDARVTRKQIIPGSMDPPSAVDGGAFIASRLASYRKIPFRTFVGAVFIFDDHGALVEIRVRKSVDGP